MTDHSNHFRFTRRSFLQHAAFTTAALGRVGSLLSFDAFAENSHQIRIWCRAARKRSTPSWPASADASAAVGTLMREVARSRLRHWSRPWCRSLRAAGGCTAMPPNIYRHLRSGALFFRGAKIRRWRRDVSDHDQRAGWRRKILYAEPGSTDA
jgi:hypothetical protein